MNYTAQIIYSDFTEVFNVNLSDELRIELKEVIVNPIEKGDNILTLDLSKSITDSYSIFPFEESDLSIIQRRSKLYIVFFTGGVLRQHCIGATDMIEYLLDELSAKRKINYFGEDEHVLVNSLFNDFIANDFSCSDINRKVKLNKCMVVSSLISDKLGYKPKRIIIDETFLGDFNVEQIVLGLNAFNLQFLKISKINNLVKVLILLNKEKIFKEKVKFFDHIYLVNTTVFKGKITLRIVGNKIEHYTNSDNNYRLKLDRNNCKLYANSEFLNYVTGTVYIFNGNDKDLLI